MAWYHWIGTSSVIIAALALFTIPVKPIGLIITLITIIFFGVLMIMFLPEKDDAYDKMRQREAEEIKQKDSL